MGARTIEGRLLRGVWHAVHQGVYAVGHRVLSQRAWWMAGTLAAGRGAVLSHRSAAQLWGMAWPSGIAVEVTRPKQGRSRPGLVIHHVSLPADEVTEVDGIPVTEPARTAFDLASRWRGRELERAWNEMEVRRLLSRVPVPALLERHPRRPGATALRALMASEAPGGVPRNEFEEAFVALLDRAGLPRPELNADLMVRGRFVEVDCLWRRQRVAVELDGRAVHAREAAFESDRRRDRQLLAEGWRPDHVTWLQLRDEPAAVAADLRATLAWQG